MQKVEAVKRSCGKPTLAESSWQVHLGAAIEAISAGVETHNWSSVAEGLAMLEEFWHRIEDVNA